MADRRSLLDMMPEGSDPNYGRQFMPSQALSAYQPTFRDRLAQWMMGDQKPTPEKSKLVGGLLGSTGLGNTGMGLLDLTPAGIPMQAQEAYRAGDDRMLAMALMPGTKKPGIKAFHGSPHDFERFSMDKIGSGEGAQAYGHGLYFAENEGVAKTYKDAGPAASQQYDVINGKLTQLAREMDKYRGPQYGKYNDPKGYELKAEYDRLMEEKTKVGRMYEVSIKAEPDDFLDWDKPLSQQSEKVRAALEKKGIRANKPSVYHEPGEGWFVDGNTIPTDHPAYGRPFKSKRAAENYLDQTGFASDNIGAGEALRGYYRSLQSHIDDPGLSADLRDAGIPGIRYLDQGSRNAGEGSRNYVLFRDDIIDVVKKYGIAFAASMYGMDQVQGAIKDQPRGLLPSK